MRHSVRWFSRPKLRISRLKSLSSKDRLERKVQTNVQFSFSWERKAFLYKIVLRGIRGFLHAGAPNGNFRENICSEDDLRSRKYVQQCYVKWFWTISSLGAPVHGGALDLFWKAIKQINFWRSFRDILYTVLKKIAFLKGNLCICEYLIDIFYTFWDLCWILPCAQPIFVYVNGSTGQVVLRELLLRINSPSERHISLVVSRDFWLTLS